MNSNNILMKLAKLYIALRGEKCEPYFVYREESITFGISSFNGCWLTDEQPFSTKNEKEQIEKRDKYCKERMKEIFKYSDVIGV